MRGSVVLLRVRVRVRVLVLVLVLVFPLVTSSEAMSITYEFGV
jgi:hypothetical protein